MQSEGLTTGELSTKVRLEVVVQTIVNYKTTVEWTIEDVFSYTKVDKALFSTNFSVPDSEWYLSIYPNGNSEDDTEGWISVYLNRSDYSKHPKTVKYSFAVKKTDGTTEETSNGIHVYENRYDYDGINLFLWRSDVESKMTELAPSGCLTITCSLTVMNDDSEYTPTEIAGHKMLSQNLKDMFISQRGSDVTLKVKEEKFSVHKSILTARSPVLAAMFEVDMKEKNTGIVDIVDCQPKPFRDFIAYLYSGELENLSDDVFELYRIADKYDVEHLKSACVQCILSILSVDNVLEAALVGDQFGERELKSKAQEFFDENVSEIVSNAKWKRFLKNYLDVGNELLINMVKKIK